MTDQEKRKIVLKLLAQENAKGRLPDDISRRSLNERSIGAGQFRAIPSKKGASEFVKESEQAVASTTEGGMSMGHTRRDKPQRQGVHKSLRSRPCDGPRS